VESKQGLKNQKPPTWLDLHTSATIFTALPRPPSLSRSTGSHQKLSFGIC